MDELYLVKEAQKGNLDAYNTLVLAHQDLAYNLAFRMLGDLAAAEDATQTAFISAFRNLNSYRGGSFKAWVMRMVTNACYDELRRRHRHPSVALEPAVGEEDDEMESPRWLASDDPSPEENLERAELGDAIQNCLQRLGDDFRAVVVLIDIEGLDYQEVSNMVQTPLGTIKSRLARARMKLRECLKHHGELLPAEYRHQGEVM